MTFGAPYWLFALALVPALLALYVWNGRRRRELLRQLVAARLQDPLAGSVSTGRGVRISAAARRTRRA